MRVKPWCSETGDVVLDDGGPGFDAEGDGAGERMCSGEKPTERTGATKALPIRSASMLGEPGAPQGIGGEGEVGAVLLVGAEDDDGGVCRPERWRRGFPGRCGVACRWGVALVLLLRSNGPPSPND